MWPIATKKTTRPIASCVFKLMVLGLNRGPSLVYIRASYTNNVKQLLNKWLQRNGANEGPAAVAK